MSLVCVGFVSVFLGMNCFLELFRSFWASVCLEFSGMLWIVLNLFEMFFEVFECVGSFLNVLGCKVMSLNGDPVE